MFSGGNGVYNLTAECLSVSTDYSGETIGYGGAELSISRGENLANILILSYSGSGVYN